MLFKDYNLDHFIKELSSDAPSPGGGSTAALVAALASSLNSMVYSLTVGKKSFEKLTSEEKNNMLRFQKEAKEFTELSKEFMERDRHDFVELMAAYRLPKETDEEKKIREEVIKENTLKAMNAPLDLALEAIKFYENIEFAIKFGNKNLISDAGVAATLLNAAIESSIINVKINLNSLRNESYALEVEKKCEKLLEDSKAMKDRLIFEVNKVIYPVK